MLNECYYTILLIDVQLDDHEKIAYFFYFLPLFYFVLLSYV